MEALKHGVLNNSKFRSVINKTYPQENAENFFKDAMADFWPI